MLPKFAPDAGLTEWGLGWSSDLCITRMRLVGEVDYKEDGFVTPWGRVERTTGSWHPVGLTQPVRLRYETATRDWVAEKSDATFRFKAADAISGPRGIYAWCLSGAEDNVGDKTTFKYWRNRTDRPFLDYVTYARGQARVRLEYEALAFKVLTYRAGKKEELDHRVSAVVMEVLNAGEWKVRWRYDLDHQRHGAGLGFLLRHITRGFASGAKEPPIEIAYQTSSDYLKQAKWNDVTGLEAYVARVGDTGLQPTHATFVDVDDDGVEDFEHHYAGTLVRHTAAGWRFEDLPALTGTEDPRCRPPDSGFNRPRTLTRLWDADEPHVLVADYDVFNDRTTLVACKRDGHRLSETTVRGKWVPSSSTRLVDLDRDRRPDLLRVFAGGYEVLPNVSTAGALRFGTPERGAIDAPASLSTIWVHDANGDGIPDIVGRHGVGLLVWHGKGKRSYAPIGANHLFVTKTGASFDSVASSELTFVDVDRDGAVDVVVTNGAIVMLFVNSGGGFQEVEVVNLAKYAPTSGMPVPIDLSGSGESEIAFSNGGVVRSFRFSSPGIGLPKFVDDGKGGRLELDYARGAPVPRSGRRQSLLSDVRIRRNGILQYSGSFDYEKPVLQSQSRDLVGYELVRERTQLGTSEAHFRVDDGGPTVDGSLESSASSPLVRFNSTTYEEFFVEGIRGLRETNSSAGWREGLLEIAEHTTTKDYERARCARWFQRQTAFGSLQVTTTFASPKELRTELHCLEKHRTTRGEHPSDPKKDFVHEFDYARFPNGRLRDVVAEASGARRLLQSLEYDVAGRPRKLKSPDKGVIDVARDKHGIVERVTRADGTFVEVRDRDTVSDLPRHIVTSRGGVVHSGFFRFDALERLERSWDSFGSTSELRPRVRYTYAFGSISRFAVATDYISPAEGIERREERVFDARGTQIALVRRTDRGRVVDSTMRVRDIEGTTEQLAPIATTLPPDEIADPTWLFANRLVVSSSRTDPLDAVTRLATTQQAGVRREVSISTHIVEDSLETVETEATGETRRSRRDAGGRVLSLSDEAGHISKLDYDASGRLTSVTLPSGAKHTRRFDAYGHVEHVDHADFGSVKFTYDAATGRLQNKTWRTDTGAIERSVTFGYDGIGRVTEHRYEKAGAPTIDIALDFGGPSDGVQHGLLREVRGSGWTRSWKHNPDASEREERLAISGWRTLVRSDEERYDDGAIKTRVWSLLDAAGTPLRVVREELPLDSIGRQKAELVDGVEVLGVTFDDEGRIDLLSRQGETTTRNDYDRDTHRLRGWTRVGAAWPSVSWSFAPQGFVGSETLGSGERTFRRDVRGLLKSVDEAPESYVYDVDRLQVRPTPRATVGDTTFDAFARVEKSGTRSFRYGSQGRVVESGDWAYRYDEQGERVVTTRGGRPVRAYFEKAVFDDTHVKVPVRVGGRIVGILRDGAFVPVNTDPRGTPLAGQTPPPYGQPTPTGPDVDVLAFAGNGFEPSLGAVRMGVRDYDPRLGIFWSQDPSAYEALDSCAEDPHLCNLYGYANGDPITLKDPDGRAAQLALPVGLAVMGAAFGTIRAFTDPSAKTAGDKLKLIASGALGGLATGTMLALPGVRRLAAGERALWVGFSTALGMSVERASNGQRTTTSQLLWDTAFGALFQGALEKTVGWIATRGATGPATVAEAKSIIEVRAAEGRAFEDKIAAEAQRDGWTVAREVTLETPSGGRTRMDQIWTKPGEQLRCIECKASPTAPLTKGQRTAHPQIASEGATVVGAGKPSVPGGTQIPPTTVEVRRGP